MAPQLFFGRSGGVVNRGDPYYLSPLECSINWSYSLGFFTGITYTQVPVRHAGTFANLSIHLSTAPGGSDTHVFRIMKNGVATALACTITGAATSAADTTHSVHFDVGDVIALEDTQSGGPDAAIMHWLEFTPDTPGDVIYGRRSAGHTPTTGTHYWPIITPGNGQWNAALDQAVSIVVAAGSFDSYEINMMSAPGAGKSLTFRIVKNGVVQDGTGGTVDTTAVLTGAGSGTGITHVVWTGNLPVVNSDLIAFQATAAGTPNDDHIQIGFGFTATTPGEYTIAIGDLGGESSSVPSYSTWPGATAFSSDWNATESNRLVYGGPTSLTLSGVLAYLFGNPGGGRSFDFNIRVNLGVPAGGPTVNVGVNDTLKSGSGSVTITNGQSFDLQSVPHGSPLAGGGTISFGVGVPAPTTEPTFLDGSVTWPETWLEFTDRANNLKVFAEVDLCDDPDYYGGYKWPWVVHFNTVARGLSDLRGQIQQMNFGAQLSDLANPQSESRYFRKLLDSPATKYITNRPLVERMIDDEDRRRKKLPRIIACGYVSDYTPSAGFQFSISGSDWLAKKFAKKRKAQEGWQPLMTLADFPNLHQDLINQAVPIIFGIVADDYLGGVTGGPVVIAIKSGVPYGGFEHSLGLGDPELGVDWNPAIADYSLSTDYPAVPVPIRSFGVLPGAVPTGLTVTDVAGGSLSGNWRAPEDGQTWSVMVTAIHGGVESDPTNVKSTYLHTSTGKRTIRVNWTASSPAADGGYNVYFENNPYAVNASFSTYGATFHVGSTLCRKVHVAAGVTTLDIVSESDGVQYPVENVFVYVVAAINPDGTESPQSGTVIAMSHPYARPLHLRWYPYAGATGYRIKRAIYPGPGIAPNYTTVFEVSATGTTGPQTIEGTTQYEFFDDFTASPPGVISTTTGTSTVRVPKGQIKPIYVGKVDIGDAVPRETFLVAGHACKAVRSVFIDGTAVLPSQYGTEVFSPGQTGWPLGAQHYVVLNGHWYTVVQVAGAAAQGAVDGSKKLTVNVEGIEDVGDGTGACILDGASQFLHFVRNWLAQDSPWTHGAWSTTPDFPAVAGLKIIDEASFATAGAVLDARQGVPYEGGGVIGADGAFISALDVIADFCMSYDLDAGFNRKGQFFASAEPNGPITGTNVDDVISIVDQSFSLEDRVNSEFFNVLPYKHTKDYAGWTKNGWGTEADLVDTQSVTLYDQERESQPWELNFLRSDTLPGQTTIADSMHRKGLRFRNPRRWVNFTLPFSGLAYELGDVIPVSIVEGLGDLPGWVGNNVRVMRHEVEPTTGQVKLTGVDLTPQFRDAYILGDDNALAASWLTATIADKVYGYLADDVTGLFTDGDPGKVLT